MATVEAGKGEAASEQKAAEPQFHQLSDQEVVQKLEAAGKKEQRRSKLVITEVRDQDKQESSEDKDAELIVESPSQRQSPAADKTGEALWGTKSAAALEPELLDDAVASVVADDMTTTLDVEELD